MAGVRLLPSERVLENVTNFFGIDWLLKELDVRATCFQGKSLGLVHDIVCDVPEDKDFQVVHRVRRTITLHHLRVDRRNLVQQILQLEFLGHVVSVDDKILVPSATQALLR